MHYGGQWNDHFLTKEQMDNGIGNTDVVGVIVTYNRLALLKETVGAVMGQTHPLRKTIIIDNHSTDGTAEYLASIGGNNAIETVRLATNTGGAGGFAEGIRRAALCSPGWIWVMDDDTVPAPDAVERMVPFMGCNGVGFLNSKVVWTDGSLHLMNLPGRIDDEARRKAALERLGLVEGCGAEPIEGASFVSLFVRGSLPREAKKGFVVKQSLLGFLSSGAQQEGKGRHTSSVICVGIDITNTVVVVDAAHA